MRNLRRPTRRENRHSGGCRRRPEDGQRRPIGLAAGYDERVWTRRARRLARTAALLLLGCASPRHQGAVMPAHTSESESEVERESRVPHSCFGATVTISLVNGMSPAEALPEPELGPELPPSPELPIEMDALRWAAGSGARAVAPAIERELSGTRCRAFYKWNDYHWVVECSEEEDACRVSPEAANALAERIRHIVAPKVQVYVDTCVCRGYS